LIIFPELDLRAHSETVTVATQKLEKNNLTATRRIRKKAEGIVHDDGKMRMMMREERGELMSRR
jgi:hypothetical protein